MKNNFKTYAKKSVSLFLAVLMVMSCWVWMAPQEAKADYTTGEYYVKYYVSNISEAGNNGKWSGNTMTINYTKTDGTTGSKTVNLNKSNYTSTGTEKLIWEGYVPGFPNNIGWYMKMGYQAFGSVYLNVRGAYFLVGKDVSSCTNSVTSRDMEGGADSFKWQQDAIGQGTKEATFTIHSNSGTPYINTLDSMGTTTINAPVWGSTDTVSTTAVKPANAWDQYGVKWLGQLGADKYEYTVLDGASGTTDANDQTKGVWVTETTDGKGQVNISAAVQENWPINADAGGKRVFRLKATVKNTEGTDIESYQTITVNYTPISYTFNADGSVSGLKATIKDSAGNNLGTSSYSASGYYGNPVTVPTNNSVSAGDGYTFLGFWTEPQPSDKNSFAYYYSKEADFAYPVSTADYNSLPAVENVTEYKLDENGRKVYPAGEQWNPDENKTLNGNKTFHGWWLSKDLSVKFYDVDGKFLGERLVKSGQTQADIKWETSKYVDTGYTSGAFTFTVDPGIWVTTDGTEINKNSYTFTKNLILTPKLTQESFKDKYAVSFINPNNGNSVVVGNEGGNYDYRANIKSRADEALGKIADTPSDVDDDLDYSYELLGWSSVKPTTGKNYHVLLEDADFDVNGTAIGLNSDWVVRNDAHKDIRCKL